MEQITELPNGSNDDVHISNDETIPKPDDEEIQECQSYSADETFQALSPYLDYDFEPGKIRSADDDSYQEDLYIGTSTEEHLNLEGAPFCKFIDDEPGISAEPEELSGPQKVLQNVLIPCLHEYLQNYSSSENADEDLDEEQKALPYMLLF
uniref:Uncharacterized protein n=1 Tax=Panagrolaimus sp. ES5 TaxID=591445 RepID=A0AC34F1I2_9BILA